MNDEEESNYWRYFLLLLMNLSHFNLYFLVQTLATAVIQLLVPNFHQNAWNLKDTGVVCLVRDTTKRSYFIQVYSLRSRNMIFRQEIYNQFEYRMLNDKFLSFEGDVS
jgi:dipeptidyl aminopeptidase/acylaminoacyl peptidase